MKRAQMYLVCMFVLAALVVPYQAFAFFGLEVGVGGWQQSPSGFLDYKSVSAVTGNLDLPHPHPVPGLRRQDHGGEPRHVPVSALRHFGCLLGGRRPDCRAGVGRRVCSARPRSSERAAAGARADAVPAAITLAVRGRKDVVGALRPDSLSAFVDLAGLGRGQYNLRVRVEPLSNIETLRVDPADIRVTLR